MPVMRRAALALAFLCSSAARADAAFPTGMSVLLPRELPQRILVGTTFGLVLSEDRGATFRYVCEPYITGTGVTVLVYQVAANGDVLAAHQTALSRTSDQGCTWTRASGIPSDQLVLDAFFDPSNAASVTAIAWPPPAGASLFASADGGRTFGTTLLTSGTPPVRADERLLSVEIAASAPVVYVTTLALPGASSPAGAALLRSGDRGATWSRFDLAVAPNVQVKIAQVDPVDANTVYLLVSTASADEIHVSHDGGATVVPLFVPVPSAFLGGFVATSDGHLYAGTSGGDFYVRTTGATEFTRLKGPHMRCLGERDGRIYACGDSTVDPYDVATSDDQGKSFQKLLSFTEILGPATCPAVQSACAADFAQLQRALAAVPVGSCSCGDPSGDAVAVLILLAAALRRRRRAPARDRR